MAINHHIIPEHVQTAIHKVASIIKMVHRDTFDRYRSAGQVILDAGYNKGSWSSKARVLALDTWGISQRTFSRMIQLAELSPEDFSHVVANFPSLHAWAASLNTYPTKPLPPLPDGRYRTIVVDPPWPVKKILRRQRLLQEEALPYPTMSLQAIKDFPVQQLMPDGCHIYLWTTHRFLPAALEVFKAWGVKYECLLTWIKNVGMTPYSWMRSTEHVLFGRHGSLELQQKGLRLDFHGKRREHSRKPDAFYELVRLASPRPRIDLFSREHRPGFDAWGDEVGRFNS